MIKILLATLAFLLFTTTGWATNYYVDAGNGNDLNDGTSPATAWQTLGQVSSFHFKPGDSVFLQRGDVWNENLTVPSSGNVQNPVTFGAYGEGNEPIISGGGVRPVAIRVASKKYVIIQDLKLIGWTNRGIYATNVTSLTIKRNFISGGNGIAPDHGIQVRSPNGLATGVRIEDNFIGRIGLSKQDTFPFNGILVQGVDGCLITGNQVKTKNTGSIRLMRSGQVDNVDCLISENLIKESYGGINVGNSDNTIVRSNTIKDGFGCGVCVGFDSDQPLIVLNLIENLKKSKRFRNGIDINGSANGIASQNTIRNVYNHSLVIDDFNSPSNGWLFTGNTLDARKNRGTRLPLRIEVGIQYTSDNNAFGISENGLAADYMGLFLDFPGYQDASGQDANSLEF